MSDHSWDDPTNAPYKGNGERTAELSNDFDLRPSWPTAMSIYLMVLESGTEQGKRDAREDLMKLARDLEGMNVRAEP